MFLYGGALYRRDEDGQALTEAIDPAMRSCSVHPATRAIAERAFQEHPAIEQVELPYGCVEIGPNAFCGCKNLQAVGIPPSMERIGTRAFFDAALTSFHLPAALTYLGSCALAKERADGGTPTLRTVTIDPANEQFFMQNGILCERVADYVRAVLYVGPETDVTIPDAVTEIGPFAFVGASELERLVLHDGIKHIAPQGLAMARPPRIVEVVAHGKNETTDGEPYLRIRPTHDQHGGRAFRSAFSENRVDAQLLAQSLDRMAPYSRDAFTRMRYMVERLCDPCLLSDSARANFNLVLSRSLARFCIAIASHDWHHGYDLLAELGFLDDDTIIGAIEAVHGANDVAATAYLISLKKRLGSSIRDYSL